MLDHITYTGSVNSDIEVSASKPFLIHLIDFVGDGSDGTDRQRAQAPESLGGDVPDKYYVVTNNEVVRLKYLLIFADNTSRKR